MEYTPEKSKELIQKYGLDANTDKVWKSRGKIPDKYADPDFKPRSQLTPQDVKELERLIRVLSSEKIYTLEIARQEGIKYTAIQDARRDKSDKRYVPLRPEFVLKLKKNVQELRIRVKNLVEKLADKTRFTESEVQAMDTLLGDPRLNVRGLIGPGLPYDRHLRRIRHDDKGSLFEPFEGQHIVSHLAIFLVETAF